MKKLAVLGSTGSVGTQALDVLRFLPGFSVEALSCERNVILLLSQIAEFKPKYACVTAEAAFLEMRAACKALKLEVQIYQNLEELVDAVNADLLINALVGSAGLVPTVCALKKGMDIALANKETLVCAGGLVMGLAAEKSANIIPIDSEHSAIFQCLQGSLEKDMTKIHLTGSGGPFRKLPASELSSVSIERALKHPNWSMGKKITIDSATLMNKGLEMIEAKWLFSVDIEQINILIHPESIVHSMVEFRDGSIIAQLGRPDMRVPVSYALTYPERAPIKGEALDFTRLGALTFEEPRYKNFPALDLCKEAIRIGGTMPALLNGANEAAVASFLSGDIGFTQIPVIIEKAMGAYTYKEDYSLSDVLEADSFGKNYVYEVRKCL